MKDIAAVQQQVLSLESRLADKQLDEAVNGLNAAKKQYHDATSSIRGSVKDLDRTQKNISDGFAGLATLSAMQASLADMPAKPTNIPKDIASYLEAIERKADTLAKAKNIANARNLLDDATTFFRYMASKVDQQKPETKLDDLKASLTAASKQLSELKLPSESNDIERLGKLLSESREAVDQLRDSAAGFASATQGVRVLAAGQFAPGVIVVMGMLGLACVIGLQAIRRSLRLGELESLRHATVEHNGALLATIEKKLSDPNEVVKAYLEHMRLPAEPDDSERGARLLIPTIIKEVSAFMRKEAGASSKATPT